MILDEADGKLTPENVCQEGRSCQWPEFLQFKISICWANCFATEDEFLKPHVEKGSVLSDRY